MLSSLPSGGPKSKCLTRGIRRAAAAAADPAPPSSPTPSAAGPRSGDGLRPLCCCCWYCGGLRAGDAVAEGPAVAPLCTRSHWYPEGAASEANRPQRYLRHACRSRSPGPRAGRREGSSAARWSTRGRRPRSREARRRRSASCGLHRERDGMGRAKEGVSAAEKATSAGTFSRFLAHVATPLPHYREDTCMGRR
jgi:hypothetical protein